MEIALERRASENIQKYTSNASCTIQKIPVNSPPLNRSLIASIPLILASMISALPYSGSDIKMSINDAYKIDMIEGA